MASSPLAVHSNALRASLFASLALSLVPVACAATDPDPSRESATVGRIGDGDTLELRGGARVRLVQIDAPELGRESATAARL